MRRSGTLSLLATFFLLFVPQSALAQPVDTFTVTVEGRSSEHPYQEGYPEIFAVDGVQGKELILEKGETYLFQMDGVSSFHPFYLTTSAVGVGAEEYDAGVEGNGASGNGELTFTPPTDAPDSLWYQCTNHRKMGWRMALVDESAEATVASDGTVSFEETGVSIDFAGTSGSGAVRVSKFNSAPEGREGISESTVSDYRFSVRAGGDLSVGESTDLRFDVSTLPGVGDASNVTVYRRDSTGTGAFSSLETTYDAEANELVVSSAGFSEFVLASDSEPLPVELASFEARADGRSVSLHWRTTSETENAGFEVERAPVDGKAPSASWTKIGFVESTAAGDGSGAEYAYRDASPPFEATKVRYRLRQVDVDGETSVSEPVTVAVGAPERIALHAPSPNPATHSATLKYQLPQPGEVTLALYNLLGQRVATVASGRQPEGRQQLQIPLHDLASGTYVIRLAAGAQVRTRKVTVVR